MSYSAASRVEGIDSVALSYCSSIESSLADLVSEGFPLGKLPRSRLMPEDAAADEGGVDHGGGKGG